MVLGDVVVAFLMYNRRYMGYIQSEKRLIKNLYFFCILLHLNFLLEIEHVCRKSLSIGYNIFILVVSHSVVFLVLELFCGDFNDLKVLFCTLCGPFERIH